jgi:hypothetical protein
MPIQLNNLLYLTVPKSVYDLSDDEFKRRFYTYLETTITNVKDVDSPDINLRVYYSFLNKKVIRFDFEGTGEYKTFIDDNLEDTKTFAETIRDEYIDIPTENISPDTKTIKVVYTPDSKSHYYPNTYTSTIQWRL